MGFKNGAKIGAFNGNGHRWINYPNNAHKRCTKCGCLMDMDSYTYIYTDKNGNKSKECPNCIDSD